MGSWIWKKLLHLRPIVKQFLRMEIHSGSSVGFWTDLWHPIGRLIEVIGERGIQKLGIVRNAKIADVLVDNQWQFRNTRDRNIQSTLSQVKEFLLVLRHNGNNAVLWKRGEDEYKKEFSAYNTRDTIRSRHTKVSWFKLFWFKQGVRRFEFITWLVIKDRLSTGVRTRAWGIRQGCPLCGETEESRDHLFFACPYTYGLWLQVIGSLLRPAPLHDWAKILATILSTVHDRLTSILLRLAFQVTIYYIWRERNERRHTQKTRPAHQLGKLIDKTIRKHILSTRYHEKRGLEGLMQHCFSAHIGQS